MHPGLILALTDTADTAMESELIKEQRLEQAVKAVREGSVLSV